MKWRHNEKNEKLFIFETHSRVMVGPSSIAAAAAAAAVDETTKVSHGFVFHSEKRAFCVSVDNDFVGAARY